MSETTHQEIEEQFSSYYDGELEADKVEALEKHLATCDECKGAYDSFKDTVEAISGLGKVPAPAKCQAPPSTASLATKRQ